MEFLKQKQQKKYETNTAYFHIFFYLDWAFLSCFTSVNLINLILYFTLDTTLQYTYQLQKQTLFTSHYILHMDNSVYTAFNSGVTRNLEERGAQAKAQFFWGMHTP